MEKRNEALLKRRAERAKAIPAGCTFKPDISISRRAPLLISSTAVKASSESQPNALASIAASGATSVESQPESAPVAESPLELAVKDLHLPSSPVTTATSAKAASERLYQESKDRERRIEARLCQPVRQDCTFSPSLISSSKKVPKSYVSPPNLPSQPPQKSKGAVAAELASAAELTFSPAILQRSTKLVNEKNFTERLYDNSWTRMRKDETFNDSDIRAAQKFSFKPSVHSSPSALLEKNKKGEEVCDTIEGLQDGRLEGEEEEEEEERGGSDKKKRVELLYSRAMDAKLEREAMKLIVLERELESCTFAPDVSRSSQSARLIGIGSCNAADPPFHTRLFENAEMRSERLRKMTAAALSAEEENLKGLFSPTLSQRSRVLSKTTGSPNSLPRHEILYKQGVSRIASKEDKSISERMSEEDKKECTFSPITLRSLTVSSEKEKNSGKSSVFEKLFLDAESRASVFSTPPQATPSLPQRTYTGPITDVIRAALN